MRRINLKISIIVLCYFLVVSALFFLAVLWVQRSLNEIPATAVSNNNVYLLTEKEFHNIYRNNLSSFDVEQITSVNTIYHLLMQAVQAKLMLPIFIGFGLFLIISSVILWGVLKWLYTYTISQIVQNFKEFDQVEEEIENHPELAKAFQIMLSRNIANIEDFKRLYHYLSHEQKNAVTILRHNMELHQNKEDLECLEHVSQGIDDVLTLSENEELAEKSEVNVIMVCAAVCDRYRYLSKNIIFDYEEDIEPIIFAKERWIIRAVSNLIDNAIKYGQGKPIEITVKNQHNCVIISVKDFGVGICEEEQKRIFDHWFRVTPLKKDGYGIGLSLVSHVCDLCGGYVTVDSALGKGATFYLSFPCMMA